MHLAPLLRLRDFGRMVGGAAGSRGWPVAVGTCAQLHPCTAALGMRPAVRGTAAAGGLFAIFAWCVALLAAHLGQNWLWVPSLVNMLGWTQWEAVRWSWGFTGGSPGSMPR